MNTARTLESHKVNPANDTLEIEVLDQPGAGGACHVYGIYGFHTETNESAGHADKDETCLKIHFQNGPIPEKGVNGVTQEALLSVVEDRLAAFQAGQFACEENQRALDAVREAQHWLHFRTLKRMARGVEGTHQK